MKTHNRNFISLALFTAILAIPAFAGAQSFLDAYKKPPPTIAPMPQKDFEDKTTLFADTPLGDKRLSYEIRLPKDWRKATLGSISDGAISSKILTEVAHFYGPQPKDVRSSVSIQVGNLDYKQTAQQWLIQYFVASSYPSQGMMAYDDGRAEAMYMHIEKDAQYLTRIVAQINGKRIVTVEYFLPTDNWADEKQMQAQTLQSFKLTTPVQENIETMAQYNFLDIAHFTYPQTWQLRTDPGGAERMQAQLLNIENRSVSQKKFSALNGKIIVTSLASGAVDSIDKEITSFKNDLQRTGLLIQNPIETRKDFKVFQGLDSRPVEIFSALDQQNTALKYEFWFEVLESDDAYFFVSLVTPSRDQDYFTWARNVEAYKSLVESLAPGAATQTNH